MAKSRREKRRDRDASIDPEPREGETLSMTTGVDSFDPEDVLADVAAAEDDADLLAGDID